MNAVISGKRVLLLEDEFLLALDAAALIEDCGAIVIGPAYDIETALELASGAEPDCAVLDVNINGAVSLGVAQFLASRGVPVIYTTGYGATPEDWPSGPVIDKPYSPAQLEAALCRLFPANPE